MKNPRRNWVLINSVTVEVDFEPYRFADKSGLGRLETAHGQHRVSHSSACHAQEHSRFHNSCIPRPEKNATCADMNHKSSQRGNKQCTVPTPKRLPSKDKLND
jgi:hypothetical protein